VSKSVRACVVALAFFVGLTNLASAQQVDPKLYGELRWRLIGPFRGGRTVPAIGVPGNPNVFYIGVNNGGVWKTTDAGRTWQSLFDDQPTQSVGALAIAPSNPNIIYVGSGEGLRRPDLSVGDGIYKSTDAGRTWQHLGLRDGQQIASVLVDPRDPNRVFAAVLGHPYGPNSERGVFRSLDGGQTWQKILYRDPDTGAVDLAFDPTNAQTIYAVLWASRRPPWTVGNPYDAPGSGLFKSTDGGATWRQLSQGLPGASDHLGRIGIAIAPSDPRRMYATVDAPKLGGIYRSDDAGESWRRINSEERIWGRASDFAEVRVHPKNPDIIFVANTSTYRSTDGGQNFTAIKGAPGGDDYHRIWINPENPDIMILGSDQGATVTVNGGQTWGSWYNQPTAQFYHVITDNQFPYWVYGGQQESGSIGIASRSDYGEITFRDWHPVGIEEYGYAAPDPLHPGVIFGGKGTRYDERTHQTQDVSPVPIRTGKYRFNRTAPLIFSPVDPRILFLGSNVLFKTTDAGHSWQIISPDLTRPNPGAPPNLGVFAQQEAARSEHRGVIYSIGPSFKDVNLIWIGTDDGLIQLTRDGGTTWNNVTPTELTPWSKVAQLEASHYDTASAYAAANRFRLDDLRPYVYRTHDGGKTWQKIVTGLPDNEPVNTVHEDPERKGLLFAGTERSVYVSFDDGDHWQSLRLNLPTSSVRDLVIHGDDIVVGTHGRSFWVLDDITPLRQITSDVARSELFLFTPQTAVRVRRSTNTDTPIPPDEPAGQNPPDGAIVDYYLKSASSNPVTLEILDSAGKVVRRYSSGDIPEPLNEKELNVPTYWVRASRVLSAEAGMHRFVWDLHYPPLEGAPTEHPISAIPHDTPLSPLGPLAPPSQYSVRLAVGGRTFTQPLTVKIDPRVAASPDELRRQFETEQSIAAALHRDNQALSAVREMRKQIAKLLGQHSKADATLKSFDEKLAAIEGKEGGTVPPAGLATVIANLAQIYDLVDSADAAPTSQQLAALNEATQSLDRQLAAWEAIKRTDLPPLNKQLRELNLPELMVVEPTSIVGPQR
jgi:photosystem II stability/assembly factor-like uncharacterized protein